MAYIKRSLERKFLKMSEAFKVVMVTGARQVGKSTMLKHLAENTGRVYVSMDDADLRELANRDPKLFIQMYQPPVLIDEVQFLKKHHVLELVEIVDSFEVPVLAYGLKNDFQNELFEGSYYMLAYADKIEEIKTICWCGRKATMVARLVNGNIVKQGEQIVIGGNDMYVSLCRKHYNDGRLGPDR